MCGTSSYTSYYFIVVHASGLCFHRYFASRFTHVLLLYLIIMSSTPSVNHVNTFLRDHFQEYVHCRHGYKRIKTDTLFWIIYVLLVSMGFQVN